MLDLVKSQAAPSNTSDDKSLKSSKEEPTVKASARSAMTTTSSSGANSGGKGNSSSNDSGVISRDVELAVQRLNEATSTVDRLQVTLLKKIDAVDTARSHLSVNPMISPTNSYVSYKSGGGGTSRVGVIQEEKDGGYRTMLPSIGHSKSTPHFHSADNIPIGYYSTLQPVYASVDGGAVSYGGQHHHHAAAPPALQEIPTYPYCEYTSNGAAFVVPANAMQYADVSYASNGIPSNSHTIPHHHPQQLAPVHGASSLDKSPMNRVRGGGGMGGGVTSISAGSSKSTLVFGKKGARDGTLVQQGNHPTDRVYRRNIK